LDVSTVSGGPTGADAGQFLTSCCQVAGLSPCGRKTENIPEKSSSHFQNLKVRSFFQGRDPAETAESPFYEDDLLQDFVLERFF